MSEVRPPRTAMVFAAGMGTRMRPISDTLPKPLVRVGGKALIDHALDRCAEAGVTKAVVNVHHLADLIEAHVGDRRQPRIVLSDERDELLDQGGGIKHALAELGDGAFYVCNTDAFWLDRGAAVMPRLAAAWDPQAMDVLLLVADRIGSIGVDWPGDFGMAADGRLVRRPAAETAPFVYAGIGIMKAEPFAAVEARIFKLAPFFFEAAARGRLFGQRLDGLWMHVGTPAAIGEAERALLEATPSPAARFAMHGSWSGAPAPAAPLPACGER